MLARLETMYLGILRVVILVVATIALVVAGLGVIAAMPPLLRQLGVTSPTATPGTTLGEYIEEKKQTSSQPEAGSTAADAQPQSINVGVSAAAKSILTYSKGARGTTQSDWETLIASNLPNIPVDQASAYLKSLNKLTDQLLISKGKPLTNEQIAELIQWHRSRYFSGLATEASERAVDQSKFLVTLSLAAGAFFFFILVVFTFLFVKVERSLRVVHTVRVEETDA